MEVMENVHWNTVQYLKRPIVLEVERPVEEMAKRRISFYQRQGFTLWEKDYCQPPYKPGDDFLPMYLMVHGELDCEKDFETISQYVFASSWTYSNEESIPFWAMYTNDMHGVRIGLPKIHLKNILGKKDPYHNSNIDKENTFPISEKKAKGENYFISPFYEEFFSVKVNYSDDEDKLNPCIKEKGSGVFTEHRDI